MSAGCTGLRYDAQGEPPLCAWCGVERVRWGSHGRWQTHCSRACGCRAARAKSGIEQFNRARRVAFFTGAIREAVGATWRDGAPVSLAQLVALSRRTYVAGYQNGYKSTGASRGRKR